MPQFISKNTINFILKNSLSLTKKNKNNNNIQNKSVGVFKNILLFNIFNNLSLFKLPIPERGSKKGV